MKLVQCFILNIEKSAAFWLNANLPKTTSILLHLLAINPVLFNALILYSMKTPENQRSSGVFKVNKMETYARSGLRPMLPSYRN